MPPENRKSKLAGKSWVGRYVGHIHNKSMCLILDESTHRVFHAGRTDVRECSNTAADCMSYVLDPWVNDGSFIDHYMS